MALHIVHIEDDKPLRNVLEIMLRTADPDIQMHQFTNAEASLEYIRQNRNTINLFVIDIRLSGKMTGIELAEQIRALNCPGYVILTSAYNSPSPTLLKKLHAEYFPKPWHLVQITEKLLRYRQLPDGAANPPPSDGNGR